MEGRALRPYPPVVVDFGGGGIAPASFVNLTPIVVQWKRRDRRKQTISLASDPDEAVEVGTEFCVRHGPPGFETVTVLGDATATSGNFNLDFKGYSRVEFFARRGGYESNHFEFDTVAENGAGASVSGLLGFVTLSGVVEGFVTVRVQGSLPTIAVEFTLPAEVEVELPEAIELTAPEADVQVIADFNEIFIISTTPPDATVSLEVVGSGDIGTITATVPTVTLEAGVDKTVGTGIYALPAITLGEPLGLAESGEPVEPVDGARMRKTPIWATNGRLAGGLAFSTASVTRYYSPAGQHVPYVDFAYALQTTEGAWRKEVGADGVIEGLAVNIQSNGRTGSATVFTLMVNGVATTQTLSVPANGTGWFVTSGVPVGVQQGDLLSVRVETGAGGGDLVLVATRMAFEADDGTVMHHQMQGDLAINQAVTTSARGGPIHGTVEGNSFAISWDGGPGSNNGYDARVHTAGVASRLSVYVPTNTATVDQVMALYINGVITDLAVTIPAGTTGVFSNNADTVDLTVGDRLHYRNVASAGGGTGSSRIGWAQMIITRDEPTFDVYVAQRASDTLQGYSGADHFIGTGLLINPGTNDNDGSTFTRLAMPMAGTVSDMWLRYNHAGAGTLGYSYTLRKNGANTPLSVAAPSTSGSGTIEDTTNEVHFDIGDRPSVVFRTESFSQWPQAWGYSFTGDLAPVFVGFTGADEEIVVPTGASFATVKAWAGGGGSGSYSPGSGNSGAGGYVEVNIPCDPGDVIRLEIGEGGDQGINAIAPGGPLGGLGGWPDGGFGSPGDTYPGGGGGSTRIYLNGTMIAVAGAGGGGSGYSSPAGAGGARYGQAGGGSTGGSQTAGGIKVGLPADATYYGDFLQGGNGGPANTGSSTADGGGGGGGYYGGGGGGGDGGTGGGGSGWVHPDYDGFTSGGYRTTPGNETDPDYVSGIGVGQVGNANLDGGNGRAVIRFASAAPARPVAVVQAETAVMAGSTGGNPLEVTFDTAPTEGNTLVALVMANSTPSGVPLAASGWTRVAVGTPTTEYGYMGCAYYIKTAGPGESTTQTVTGTSNAADMVTVFEIEGLTGTFASNVAAWTNQEFIGLYANDTEAGAGYIVPANSLALMQAGLREDFLVDVGDMDITKGEVRAGNRSTMGGYSYRTKGQKMRPLTEVDIGTGGLSAISILFLKT